MICTVQRRRRSGVPKRSCWVFFQAASARKTSSGRESITNNFWLSYRLWIVEGLSILRFGTDTHTRIPVEGMTTRETEEGEGQRVGTGFT